MSNVINTAHLFPSPIRISFQNRMDSDEDAIQNPGGYLCKGCNDQFPTYGSCERHISRERQDGDRDHRGIEPERLPTPPTSPCQCPACETFFPNYTTCWEHIYYQQSSGVGHERVAPEQAEAYDYYQQLWMVLNPLNLDNIGAEDPADQIAAEDHVDEMPAEDQMVEDPIADQEMNPQKHRCNQCFLLFENSNLCDEHIQQQRLIEVDGTHQTAISVPIDLTFEIQTANDIVDTREEMLEVGWAIITEFIDEYLMHAVRRRMQQFYDL